MRHTIERATNKPAITTGSAGTSCTLNATRTGAAGRSATSSVSSDGLRACRTSAHSARRSAAPPRAGMAGSNWRPPRWSRPQKREKSDKMSISVFPPPRIAASEAELGLGGPSIVFRSLENPCLRRNGLASARNCRLNFPVRKWDLACSHESADLWTNLSQISPEKVPPVASISGLRTTGPRQWIV